MLAIQRIMFSCICLVLCCFFFVVLLLRPLLFHFVSVEVPLNEYTNTEGKEKEKE